jgi:photosystem II stability/assembly factor-like uncharacterized protein
MIKFILRSTLALTAFAAGTALCAAADPPLVPAVLGRPAMQTARATQMAMLAIARAGARVVAVGEAGVVLLSDDDGKSWRQARVPVSVSLTAVQFLDARLGYATGQLGVVLKSTVGGESWSKLLDGAEAAQLALEHAQAKKAALGPEAGEDAVKAADKSLHNARLLVADGPDKPFLGLYFSDAANGYIFGAYNLIFHTSDGGQSWTPWLDRVANPMGFHLYGMAAAGGDLFLAGEQGLLLRSGGGGEHFEALASPYKGSYFGITSTPGGELIAYGLRGNAYRSGDLGETWSKIETGLPVAISAGSSLADGSLALISQGGAVLLSKDAGQSFQAVPRLPPLPLSGLVQAGDGSLVAASLAGPQRLAPDGQADGQ